MKDTEQQDDAIPQELNSCYCRQGADKIHFLQYKFIYHIITQTWDGNCASNIHDRVYKQMT